MTTTEVETARAAAESPKAQLHAVFNYYSLPTTPQVDDVSIVNGTSPHITSCRLPVVDLRDTPTPLSGYTHSSHGFQILHQPLPFEPSHETVHDPAFLASQYYPSITSLLKTSLGARSVVVINSTLRDIPAPDLTNFDPRNPRAPPGKSMSPFFIAHSDYTPGAARAHLRAMRPDAWFEATGTGDGSTSAADRALFLRLREEVIAAEDRAARAAGIEPGEAHDGKDGHWRWDGKGYEGPRYAMFSVWRPWEPVRRDPLAVMLRGAGPDGAPYVPLPRGYRNRPGCVPEYYNENVLVRPPTGDGEHVWGYLSEQKPEEVLALKFYDSEALRLGDGSIRLMCPHSAFRVEGTENEPVRRSCELRVWCIW